VGENRPHNPWSPFLELPKSFAEWAAQFGADASDQADSLFSFEGGGAAKPASRPYMPNLEVEAAFIDASTEKGELILELDSLKERYADLQSSMATKAQVYSETIKGVEEKNTLLEDGLHAFTITLERQHNQLQDLKQEKSDADAAKMVEGENEKLRQRLRAVELLLSEVAFESRKFVPAPPRAAVENVALIAHSTDVKDAISLETVSTSAFNQDNLLSPKAPTAPVPPHIHQKLQLEQLQMQTEEYERERSSVRKLFGLGIRRGVSKVGKALTLFKPGHNLLLWGELRGHCEVV